MNQGDWGAWPEHLCSQAFSHRNFPEVYFTVVVFFPSRKKKKKRNKNLRRMKFCTGNEIETTDMAVQQHGGVIGDVQKEEVAKLVNKLRESTTLQNRLVKHRLSHTQKSEAL